MDLVDQDFQLTPKYVETVLNDDREEVVAGVF